MTSWTSERSLWDDRPGSRLETDASMAIVDKCYNKKLSDLNNFQPFKF